MIQPQGFKISKHNAFDHDKTRYAQLAEVVETEERRTDMLDSLKAKIQIKRGEEEFIKEKDRLLALLADSSPPTNSLSPLQTPPAVGPDLQLPVLPTRLASEIGSIKEGPDPISEDLPDFSDTLSEC